MMQLLKWSRWRIIVVPLPIQLSSSRSPFALRLFLHRAAPELRICLQCDRPLAGGGEGGAGRFVGVGCLVGRSKPSQCKATGFRSTGADLVARMSSPLDTCSSGNQQSLSLSLPSLSHRHGSALLSNSSVYF